VIMEKEQEDQVVIPVVEEEVVADRHAMAKGGVRVQKHVTKRVRKIDVPILREEVQVERVTVNREVKEIPRVRRDGDVTIIPVVEEEVIVTKRIVLKEEIHITKRRIRERAVKEVEVERERAEVQRLDEHGRVTDQSTGEANGPARARSRSLLNW